MGHGYSKELFAKNFKSKVLQCRKIFLYLFSETTLRRLSFGVNEVLVSLNKMIIIFQLFCY